MADNGYLFGKVKDFNEYKTDILNSIDYAKKLFAEQEKISMKTGLGDLSRWINNNLYGAENQKQFDKLVKALEAYKPHTCVVEEGEDVCERTKQIAANLSRLVKERKPISTDDRKTIDDIFFGETKSEAENQEHSNKDDYIK